MSKFFKKYTRKLHRWLSIPFMVIMILSVTNKGTPTGATAQQWQQITILIMALSGIYLLALPWWAKWQKNKRIKNS